MLNKHSHFTAIFGQSIFGPSFLFFKMGVSVCYPDWLWTCDPLASAFWGTRIAGLGHKIWFFLFDSCIGATEIQCLRPCAALEADLSSVPIISHNIQHPVIQAPRNAVIFPKAPQAPALKCTHLPPITKSNKSKKRTLILQVYNKRL